MINKSLSAIDKWFFGDESTWALSLFRVCLGAVIINKFIFLFPDLRYWYTEQGIFDLSTALTLNGRERLNMFYWLRNFDSVTVAYAMWGAAMLFSTTFCLGLWTRISTIALYVLVTSFDHRNTLVLHGGDTFIRILLFWMMFAASNTYFSLDSSISKLKSKTLPAKSSAWPLRAMQIQVAIMYLATFWHKKDGDAWWNGTAVFTVSQLIDFKRYSIPFLYSSWYTIKLATWMTLFFEGSFAFLVWFKRTRLWILALGLFFHLGLEWHLNIPLFQWASMASFTLFLYRDDFKRKSKVPVLQN